MIRNIGYDQERSIENEAFWALEHQKEQEKANRKFIQNTVNKHKKRLSVIWDGHIQKRKEPANKF